ncbi:the Ing1 Phd finger in complex with A histone H3k4me3 peptide, partial [Phascolomyces articulosus]
QQVWCICREPKYGKMICCDNDDCQIQWFHFPCVGLNREPKGTWYCDNCKAQNPAKNPKQ